MIRPPSITWLVPDIGAPVVGPVTVLARTMAEDFPVQIVGPDFGSGVSPMYRDAFDYTVVPCPRIYRWPDILWESRRLARACTGDVVIAVKARPETIPVALRLKRTRGARAVVYLDEWDGALTERLTPAERRARWLRHAHHPADEIHIPRLERRIREADAVVSTTSFLQRKFGGEIIQMGVDTDRFQPVAADEAAALRESLGLAGKRLVVFGGVVRPHKGIELILDALAELNRPEVRLLVVGPETEHLVALRARPEYQPWIHAAGPQPAARMPAFLTLADAIVLPLRDDLLAQSQMPCKVFEAMAMARPIVASGVADLPQVLQGCGVIVPPDEAPAIARALADLFDHPEAAAAMGQNARQRCLQAYSRTQTRAQLKALVNTLCKNSN